MPALEAGIHANATWPVFAWMAGIGCLWQPSLQEDAKAKPWLWPGQDGAHLTPLAKRCKFR